MKYVTLKSSLEPLTLKYILETDKKQKKPMKNIKKLITVEVGGVVVAVIDSMYTPIWLKNELQKDRRFKRYTAFVKWEDTGDVEEIDIDALNPKYAKQVAEIEVKKNYEPGGKIVEVEQRHGLYF